MLANGVNFANLDDVARDLYNRYLPLRNANVPFPPESVAFWCILLAMQTEAGVQGDLLELGVEHGGTALLSMMSTRPDEQQVLVDLVRSPRFDEKFRDVPEAVRQRVEFIVSSTRSAATDQLVERAWRYIHIDAGHGYTDVCGDMTRYAGLLAEHGILCCDDFFFNRWPEVTAAILDTYAQVGLSLVALVNRKAYFTRADVSENLCTMLTKAAESVTIFGEIKHWKVTLRGLPAVAYQIAPPAGFLSRPL